MPNGPHLAYAFICDRVLQEKDGVLSAIRIVDTIFVQKLEAAELHGITFVIGLKSGDFIGEIEVKLTGKSPSGKSMPELKIPMKLDGGKQGATAIVTAGFAFPEAGLYWFSLNRGNDLITRMPLDVQTLPSAQSENESKTQIEDLQESPTSQPSGKA
jgi:hypothetical protein